jgi:hypothetical protein
VIKGAIGLAITAARERGQAAAHAAALGLLGGAGVALLAGRMMAGSVQELLVAFPDFRMRISGAGMLFGERGLAPIGLTVSAALEGATFCAAVAWGLRRRPADS